jgi:hypothetical protein
MRTKKKIEENTRNIIYKYLNFNFLIHSQELTLEKSFIIPYSDKLLKLKKPTVLYDYCNEYIESLNFMNNQRYLGVMLSLSLLFMFSQNRKERKINIFYDV